MIRPPVVDSHLHVWRALAEGTTNVSTIVSPFDDVPLERFSDLMDQNGVERAVLVQPLFRGEDNSYVADSAADQPDRYAAVCVVDPRTPDAGSRLEYWVKQRGCRGLRLRPRVPEECEAFHSPALYPLWQRAGELGIVISVLASTEHLLRLGELAARFPDVAVVVDHMAHPNVAGGDPSTASQPLLNLAATPNVLVKISGYYYFSTQPDPYPDCWDLVRAVYDQFGPQRLLWGSDFPHVERRTGYARSLDLVRFDLPFFADSDRVAILGGNACRLYWPREYANLEQSPRQ